MSVTHHLSSIQIYYFLSVQRNLRTNRGFFLLRLRTYRLDVGPNNNAFVRQHIVYLVVFVSIVVFELSIWLFQYIYQ